MAYPTSAGNYTGKPVCEKCGLRHKKETDTRCEPRVTLRLQAFPPEDHPKDNLDVGDTQKRQ